jgi:hypothetical protein
MGLQIDRSLVCRGALGVAIFAGAASAQPEVPDAHFVIVQTSIRVAGLTSAEIRQIKAEVEKTSFDTPDSWEDELRARRVSSGASEMLVVRGTRLLCGGTGNCQVWVFVRLKNQWKPTIGQQAPIASGLAFEDETNHGVNNLLLVANLGGDKDRYTRYRFDGKFYRPEECLDVEASDDPSGEPKVTKVRCE